MIQSSVASGMQSPKENQRFLNWENKYAKAQTSYLKHKTKTEPSGLIYIQSEDISITNLQSSKLKFSEIICATLALAGFVCGAICSDLTFNSDIYNTKKVQVTISYIFCTVTTALLLIAICWRTKRELKWEQAKGIYSYQDDLISTGKVKWLIIEIVINTIHPVYGFEDYQLSTYNNVYDVNYSYTYTSIFTVWMLIRVYHLIRVASVLSVYRSERVQRLCQITGSYAGSWFAVKCMMKDLPFYLLSSMLVGGVFILAFCLRIFERPLDEYTGKAFAEYGNSMWCAIITMTTVGYGDYFPVTSAGRLFDVLACMWGVLCVSLMVITLTNMLKLDAGQETSLTILNRLWFKEELKQLAAYVLTSAVRYRFLSKHYPDDKRKIAIQLGKFRHHFNNFQSFKIKQRDLYDFDSFEDRIEKKMIEIIEDSEAIEATKKEIAGIIEFLQATIPVKSDEKL